MMVRQDGNRLIIERGVSQVWIECWGENSVRIRMCGEPKMDENDWALEEKVPECPPPGKNQSVAEVFEYLLCPICFFWKTLLKTMAESRQNAPG